MCTLFYQGVRKMYLTSTQLHNKEVWGGGHPDFFLSLVSNPSSRPTNFTFFSFPLLKSESKPHPYSAT